jgi:hypothetical protein
VGKRRPDWQKTNIPKNTKIKLWRIMKDNPTFDARTRHIANHPDTFTSDEHKFIPMSRDTYQQLQREIDKMPLTEVRTLPEELQVWIKGLRPNLRKELQEQQSVQVVGTSEKKEHESRIRSLLEYWKRDLSLDISRTSRPMRQRYNAEIDRLFPYLLQHCPSVKEKYEGLKKLRDKWLDYHGLKMDSLLDASSGEDYYHHTAMEHFVSDVKDYLLSLNNPYMASVRPSQYLVDAEDYKELIDFLDRILVPDLKDYELIEKQKTFEINYCKAEDELHDALDTCIISHEYQRNRCEWCPPQ